MGRGPDRLTKGSIAAPATQTNGAYMRPELVYPAALARCSMKRPREETAASMTQHSGSSCHSHSFVGVYRTKSGEHWRACIGYDGKLLSVGGR